MSVSGDDCILNDTFNSWVALHNIQVGLNEIKKIRSRFIEGTLRNYLEKRSVDSTSITSCIRYLDSFQPDFIANRTTLVKNNPLNCGSNLSYKDPQIIKFQKLVHDNCEPRPCKLCVFLPCSMGKPYSKSRSHIKFIKEIRNAAKSEYRDISQVVVTSPLGLVPRELETVYPAAHYDISVTGVWDNEEIQTTALCIVNWIRKLPQSIPIIAHLSGGYLSSFKLAQKLLNDDRKYIIVEDLNSLGDTIRNELHIVKTTDSINTSNSLTASTINDQSEVIPEERENIISDDLSMEESWFKMIADFQFGKGAGQLLIGSSLRFVPSKDERYMDIFGFESFGKIEIGRYHRDSGHIRLFLTGAERIKELTQNQLVLNTDDLQGTTVFKPAVERVSPKLCSNDEVLIYNKLGQFVGVGSMIMNAMSAQNLKRGAVAKIRKIIRSVAKNE
jgi:archaeosine synthase